jgi:hypothetical protein
MNQGNKTYNIQENKLIVWGTEIVFDYQIKEVLEMSEMLIVLILKTKGITPNRNVFGVSILQKKIKWQIEKIFSQENDINCPFVGIRNYNNLLYLNNWCDVYLIVDPLTGKINERGDSGK